MKLFSITIVNRFTIALAILVFLSATLVTVAGLQEDARINLEYNQMIEDADAFNYIHALENTEDTEEFGEVEALFDSGADAFLSAYYNYINAESYHVETNGTMVNVLGGITIRTESSNTMIKYLDGSASYELISFEPGDKYGRSSAKYIYYDKPLETIYLRETSNVTKEGDKHVPHYSSPWKFDSVEFFVEEIGIMPGETIYNFSEMAISEVPFFQINTNPSTGEVVNYETQVISIPSIAGAPFARVVNYVGNATKMPIIISMVALVEVSAEGVLTGLTLNDTFKIKTKLPIVGEVTVDCDSKSIYSFISVGGEVSRAKPDLTGAVQR